MNDPTLKKNPWMYLGVMVLAAFVVWRVLALIADRINYFTDPTYKAMSQARSSTLARQIPLRETAVTAAILIVMAVVIIAAVAWLVIYLKAEWDKRHLVRPNQHGYPGVYRNGVLTVPSAPALPATVAPALGLPALPERVLIYDAPLPRDGTIPIGVRPDGSQITLPLLEAGGGLIAGNPGMGKTELLASIYVAANRLYRDSIAPVEVIVVDPKRLDFVRLPQLPNTPYPVVSAYGETIELLKELQNDIERRKRTLQNARARSVEHFHSLGGQMSIRLLLVDEVSAFTDQVSKAQKDAFIKLLAEFNSRGRAHGYSLILATQRPHSQTISREVTGIVEWRAAFHVSSDVESRMMLGQNGAENLAGKGRFLLKDGAGLMPGQAYLADLKGKFGPGFYGYLQQFAGAVVGAPTQPLTIDPAPPRYDAGITSGITAGITTVMNPPSAKTLRGDAQAHTYTTIDTETLPAPEPDGFDGATFPATARQQGYLFAKYQELGNPKAVERAVYAQEGGDKYYWTRYGIAAEQQRRGLDFDAAWLNLPERLRRKHLGGDA